MKIGILTFHCAKNYGAVLQSFALKKILENFGVTVEFIDYRPNTVCGKFSLRIGALMNQIIFSSFVRKYLLPLSIPYKSSKEFEKYSERFDLVIVGSDQVWNMDFSEKGDFTYFLSYISKKCKKLAYAASFGKDNFDVSGEQKYQIEKLLTQFEAISMREETGVLELKTLFNIKATQVLDPTFLLSAEDYSNIFSLENIYLEKQLLCFKFVRDDSFYSALQILGKKYGLKIKVIGRVPLTQKIPFVLFPSPRKWLQLFLSSEYVITDSFHGLAFAIIFKKKFVVCPANPKRFTRIKNLLKILGLENRAFSDYREIVNSEEWLKEIDYTKVNQVLAKHKDISFEFLKRSLNKN